MSSKFVEVFPLPWHIIDYQGGYISAICPAKGDSVLYFGIFDDYDNQHVEHEIHEYIVDCANMLPEIEKTLRLYLNRNVDKESSCKITDDDLKMLHDKILVIMGENP